MKTVRIDEPCSENFSSMSSTANGAFCTKCSVEVIDFTEKKPEEIRRILADRIGQRTCGHIHSSQLDQLHQDFLAWKANSSRVRSTVLFATIVVFGLSLFSCSSSQQEENLKQIQQTARNVVDLKGGAPSLEEVHPRVTETVEVLGKICVPVVDPPVLPYDGGLEIDPEYIDYLRDSQKD